MTDKDTEPKPFNPVLPEGLKFIDHSDDPVDEELARAVYGDTTPAVTEDHGKNGDTDKTPANRNTPTPPPDDKKPERDHEKAPDEVPMDDLVADRVRKLSENKRETEKPSDTAKPTGEKDDDDPDYKLPVPQFRRRYAELKKQVAELREKLEKTAPAPELESLKSENETLKKQIEEIKRSAAVNEFLESGEWERETEPLRRAHDRLIAIAARLVNPETEKPPTPDELAALLARARSARNLRELSTLVEEKLGEDARAVVVPAVLEIFEQEQRLAKLQQDIARRAEEWRKTEQEQRARIIAEASRPVFDMLGDGLGLTDEERAEMQRATRSLDEVFSGTVRDWVRRAERIGKVRAYAAAVPVLLGRIQKLQEELERARRELRSYEDSRPAPRHSAKTPEVPRSPDQDDDLEALAAKLYGSEGD